MISQCFDDSEKILEEEFKVVIFFIIERCRKANIHGDFDVPDFSGQQGVRKINSCVPQLS